MDRVKEFLASNKHWMSALFLVLVLVLVYKLVYCMNGNFTPGSSAALQWGSIRDDTGFNDQRVDSNGNQLEGFGVYQNNWKINSPMAGYASSPYANDWQIKRPMSGYASSPYLNKWEIKSPMAGYDNEAPVFWNDGDYAAVADAQAKGISQEQLDDGSAFSGEGFSAYRAKNYSVSGFASGNNVAYGTANMGQIVEPQY